MTTEEKLRNLIFSRYKSMREFAIMADIPNSTVNSVLSRGIKNSSVANVIKICKALKISADELAEGRITPIDAPTRIDTIEIKEIIDNTKERLIHGVELTLDGDPIDRGGIESIVNGLDITVEMVTRNNKNHNKNVTKTTDVH